MALKSLSRNILKYMSAESPNFSNPNIRLNRRQFLALTGGVAAELALQSCGGLPASERPQPEPSPASLEDLLTHPERYENQRICTQGFEQMNPKPYEVNLNGTPP